MLLRDKHELQFPVIGKSTSSCWFNTYTLAFFILCNILFGFVGWQMHQYLPEASKLSSSSPILPSAHRSLDVSGESSPIKFAVDYVTPYKNQAGRGTCWDFATIGVLEQSYRRHGVERSWLDPKSFVAFSEQAFGAEVIRFCQDKELLKDTELQVACNLYVGEDTEGGYPSMLYYFQNGLRHSVVPHSLKSYQSKNPIEFSIESMETYYEEVTIKSQIATKKSAMAFAISTKSATDPQCQIENCTLCPPEISMDTCCLKSKQNLGITMEGEFIAHSYMTSSGGHAMLLVGYNDIYQTRDGYTGGFIVKNSWLDEKTTGSHSIKYWLQEISDEIEALICPNSYNPFNWFKIDKKYYSYISKGDEVCSDSLCLPKDTLKFAAIVKKPLHLECVDEDICNPDLSYAALSTEPFGDHMTKMCFHAVNATNGSADNFCLKPMRPDQISSIIRPKEIYPNHRHHCGFYFVPYEVTRKIAAQFKMFSVNDFDISWTPQSYLANKNNFPEYDYGLLSNSTRTQSQLNFDGPLPFARVFEDLP
ncbi:hypothetical protein THRCLA_04037 [Thraustotheca clavata]|uniref:Peptidase C1A papain C-terminal domain-containing protein n=1 Tax=Thraustotheca clavata TaxID=74557 RepID=A0A1W0A070_9STRA|nr:hypothetical protein THRCLA_04037 [Thraustotheca clavata]